MSLQSVLCMSFAVDLTLTIPLAPHTLILAMAYTVEELRGYITDLYCNQQYTETEILSHLLSNEVQTKCVVNPTY